MPVSWNSPNLKQHDSTYNCLLWRLAWRNAIRSIDSTFPHISKCSSVGMWWREPNFPNLETTLCGSEHLMIKFMSTYIFYKRFTNCLWTPLSNKSPKDQLLQSTWIVVIVQKTFIAEIHLTKSMITPWGQSNWIPLRFQYVINAAWLTSSNSTTKIIMRCPYGAKLVRIDPFNVVCQFLSW